MRTPKIYPRSLKTWIELVIKTASRQKRPALPGKKPLGSIYNLAREGLKYYGYYDKYNLRQYDPEVYIDKYTYKPQKRIIGYAGLSKGFLKTKRRTRTSSYQFYKTSGKYRRWHNWNKPDAISCESGNITFSDCRF